MNEETTRDPLNTAVAEVLNEYFKEQDFGEARLVRATGIPRSSVRRYLSGDRDIRVMDLRKLAKAFGVSVAKVLTEAERRVK